MTAAERYAAMVRARDAQLAALATPLTEERWALYAHTYRFDPHREPEPLLAALIELLERRTTRSSRSAAAPDASACRSPCGRVR